MAGVYKLVLCILRRLRNKDDGFNSFVGGALAGLCLFLETSKRIKKLFVMAFFIRSVDTVVTLLEKKGLIKKIKHFEVYLFAPMISFLVYAYFYEKEVFPPGIDKAFIATARPTQNELTLGSDVFLRQGHIWFPGVAKKFRI